MSFKRFHRTIAMEALEGVVEPEAIPSTVEQSELDQAGQVTDMVEALTEIAEENNASEETAAAVVPESTVVIPEADTSTANASETPAAEPTATEAPAEVAEVAVETPVATDEVVVEATPSEVAEVAATGETAPASTEPPTDPAPAADPAAAEVVSDDSGVVVVDEDDLDFIEELNEVLQSDEIAEELDERIEEEVETEAVMECFRLAALSYRRVAAMEGLPADVHAAARMAVEHQYLALGLRPTPIAMESLSAMSAPAMEGFIADVGSRMGDNFVVGMKTTFDDLGDLFRSQRSIGTKYEALAKRVDAEFKSKASNMKEIDIKVSTEAFWTHFMRDGKIETKPVEALTAELKMVDYVLDTYSEACLKQAEFVIKTLKAGTWETLPQTVGKIESLKRPEALFQSAILNGKYLNDSHFEVNKDRERPALSLDGKSFSKLAELASSSAVEFVSSIGHAALKATSDSVAANYVLLDRIEKAGPDITLSKAQVAELLATVLKFAGSMTKFGSMEARVRVMERELADVAKQYGKGRGEQQAVLKQCFAVIRNNLMVVGKTSIYVAKHASQNMRFGTYMAQRAIYQATK